MEIGYTNERNVQIVLSLLKAYNIKKIVVSPGTTNITLVMSMQHDNFFEMYSCVDERSACYMACGMAEQSGEPVILSCTGATASRNYLSGLTEAYYRKLPILAITSGRSRCYIGHLQEQVIDRSCTLKDVVKKSVHIPIVKDDEDEWFDIVETNKALSELYHLGGGPVHIDLETRYSRDFSVKQLPSIRKISRILVYDEIWPQLPNGKIAIFIGAHSRFTKETTISIEKFCESNNAVVLCDHTSGYNGKYKILAPLLEMQTPLPFLKADFDLIIQIGEIVTCSVKSLHTWRVSLDGEIRDTWKNLCYVFEMDELSFFNYYTTSNTNNKRDTSLYHEYRKKYDNLLTQIPQLPFSNMWIALYTHSMLPHNCIIHFGIRNSLRSWNCFELSPTIKSSCNVGGFGIDGGLSSLIGASLSEPDKLFFGVFGDLSFFYDINSLGNRHVGKNLRILLINNGRGQEFRNAISPGSMFGEETDLYIAAAAHFGNKSQHLVQDYVKNLGFVYLSALNKEEFKTECEVFFSQEIDYSVVFEVFTDTNDEKIALQKMCSLTLMSKTVETIRQITNGSIYNIAKKIVK